MLSFIEFKTIITLLESSSNTAIVSFGRMNPPTMGHVKLMETIVELGKKYNATPLLYLSHSQDKKKNPLSYDEKIKFVKAAAPNGLQVVYSSAKTIFDVLKDVAKLGVSDVFLVAGEDRLAEYNRLKKYKDDLGFKTYKVVSAGERDPDDNDSVKGISATKLRNAAINGEKEFFIRNCALKNKSLASKLYDAVRNGMGIE